MSVFIYQADAKEMIAKVEGPEWLVHQERFGGTRNGFDSVLEEWHKIDAAERAAVDAGRDAESDDWLKRETLPDTIYGLGGWNRYIVTFKGEILFSRYHSSSQARTDAAEKIGFSIN